MMFCVLVVLSVFCTAGNTPPFSAGPMGTSDEEGWPDEAGWHEPIYDQMVVYRFALWAGTFQ